MSHQAQWLLGVETSTTQGSLALVNQKNPLDIFESAWSRSSSHSEVITREVDLLFHKAGISTKALSGVVCGCGPGSFTGIRVALNFAKTLAFAHQIPIWTIDTLRELAEAVPSSGDILCAIDAFRDLIYCAAYNRGPDKSLAVVKPPFATTVELLKTAIRGPVTVAGTAFETFWDDFHSIQDRIQKSDVLYPSAKSLLQIVNSTSVETPPFDWKSAKPLYIRASEAEEKMKSGELTPFEKKF
ncbi:MAG: tRNA (adenosine(37)-N6)-threonylcarbamoyltransferase complex dimerization subunit type 1 TsaB [Bdellovibrionales bacterium]|nr:tRNA (adenosine(37)-N6)-threonylcarbamoyltransferase complex dimerization subunit type 1 TsaB [Bdellovibrionales bacterium]